MKRHPCTLDEACGRASGTSLTNTANYLFSRKGSVMLHISGCVFCNNKAIKARLQKCEVDLEITVWRRIQINITSL